MVRPSLRWMNRVVRKTPGGRLRTEYRRKVYGKHTCAICGAVLQGTPRGGPAAMKKLTHSQRRPTRPFGGQLCSPCTRKVVAMKGKYKLKLINVSDIPISLRDYVIGDKTWQKV